MDIKKYLFIAASALALASCSSEDFVGTEGGNVETTSANKAINFGGNAGKITRADNKQGADAAKDLGNHFVVFGDKTVGNDKQTVYDHYDVQWKGTDVTKKTQTNQNGWEYVGFTPNKLSNLTNATQTIKYWDYSASQYDFVAFSLGGLTTENDAYANQEAKDATTASEGKVKISRVGDNYNYTVEGKVTDIAKLYISDKITKKKETKDAYSSAVQFNFLALKTLVRMGIFETIPGYSVKDVKFYSSTNTTTQTASETPGLFADSETIPSGYGTATISFDNNNKANVTWKTGTGNKNAKDITFDKLQLTNAESNEDTGEKYIARTSKDASFPQNYQTVIPGTTIGALTLKVDYTLVATDGSKETIKVTGATAKIPAEYTQWKANYAYTYIFKISDKTNGSTGGGNDPAGLYPITFDAIVTETETGKQETITTESDPSITTYSKEAIDDEYKTNSNIYVSVSGGTEGKSIELYKRNEVSSEGQTTYTYSYYGKLYKLTQGTSITEAEVPAILEASGMTLGGKTLTAEGNYETSSLNSHFVTSIDANDTANGTAITGNFFKFTPTDAGIYVFAYVKDNSKAYKVIKVVAGK